MRITRTRRPFAGYTDAAGFKRASAPAEWPFGMARPVPLSIKLRQRIADIQKRKES